MRARFVDEPFDEVDGDFENAIGFAILPEFVPRRMERMQFDVGA